MLARFSVITLLLAALAGSAVAAPRRIDFKKDRRQLSSDVASASTTVDTTQVLPTDSLLTATATAADSATTTFADGSGGNTTIAGNIITYCDASGFCANVTVSTGSSNDTNNVCSESGCITVNATANPFDNSNSTGTVDSSDGSDGDCADSQEGCIGSDDGSDDGSFNSTTTGTFVTVTVTVTASDCSATDSSDFGFNSTDSGFNSTDSGFNSTDSGFNSTDSGLNSTDSSFATSTLGSYAITSTFALSDLPTTTVAPTAITIQNGDGVISVIPLPTDSADSVKVKRLIKELDARGQDSSKLKNLFTKKSARLNRLN